MQNKSVKIGIDFDNTLVDYDLLFYKIALEKNLIPESIPKNKTAVRDYLRKIGKEEEWTKMQGEAYGTRILEAAAYEGAETFLKECHKRGIDTYIISHKTKHPFIGEKVDLHDSARKWLDSSGFTKYVPQNKIFFELTKEEKINRINNLECNYFIDDLPEFLSMSGFSENIMLGLFDPSKVHSESKIFTKANSWQEIENLTMAHAMASNLLSSIGVNEEFETERLHGGRNNKVWKINLKERDPLLLKSYFFSDEDKRDRLYAECSFLKYSASLTNRVPKLFAYDDKSKTAILQFVNGRKIEKNIVSKELIEQCAKFIQEINSGASKENLPQASEASFSINAHIEKVDSRLARLEKVQSNSEVFSNFVASLRQRFENKKTELISWCQNTGQALDKPISEQEIIVSPSDFGFHNALMDEKGNLTFLDFEYAGLDDSAKLICDFFCQPDIPVSKEYFDFFVRKISFGNENIYSRAKMLLPLYEIRWAAIMLNEFLKTDLERRQFASGKMDEAAAQTQLQKAINYLMQKSAI